MKRPALALLLLLALAHPAWGAAAPVQSAGDSVSWDPGGLGVSSAAVTFGSAVGSGNLVCGIVAYESTVTISSVKDDKNNTYTVVDTVTDGGNAERFSSFYLANITNAPITVTVTFSAATHNGALIVHEASGVTSTPLDKHSMSAATAFGTGVNAITTASVTPATGGEYIFAGVVDMSSFRTAPVYTAGTTVAYTKRQDIGTSVTSRLSAASEDFVQGTAAGLAGTFTQPTNADTWIVTVMTFTAAGGAACKPSLTLAGVGC